ncbi:GPI-linked NAD(P)(+)--arginine ADP-ribosyltransferase 1 [Octodon degus]|uniref:NAD(P)(+)--arginine ADP-ribosyltransferase n=1 Tax=Octodon degus TaxID=10160 RepID=A0A6P6DD85_OCTDE|nr:GPI-linked NAD(P)(+)--arginine ADP-ribosyltransferase 1 [Octodon degus]XP_023557871.1 GPI-linked NAD(P)(+)--arginine ADP-ribosyltransferase 1 [Octodon degus]XP_023557872.1 GPI-linked NAD(P)(+)--arginine ADP-ribosyltransferase 1 [Octodon degus]XP_023557873.1 GPI-linked NAD(P)(+)--arginine ADP-ribosyltransferase 1 [Octodon degus]XP_023557875.1 GPI-linked NAD(P)(+)--arginine ADP-ribosyltransferase 1 [Octodon degus]XP_023557876.1 GPI-linked NAD(P)(+)--arginine ADP-ribosyltransferase 1 [Octodon 
MQIPALLSLLLVASVGLVNALQGDRGPRSVRQAQRHSITRRGTFSQEAALDMALASFDDQYAGCAAAMRAALPELNHSEFQANRVYAEGWALAGGQWRERQAWGAPWGPSAAPPAPPGFRDEHGVALLAYTANSPLHKEFNAAVREAGRSRAHYLQRFPFKTLHFLLTEALQLLGAGQGPPRCHQVYRGVHGLRLRPTGPGATVRLGGFASASLQNVAAQQFGQDTFFGIWTCLGAPIKGYSFFPGEEEVLIPPFETFQVINASRPAQGPARIYLRALGKRSVYNCEYIKDKKCKSGPCRLDSSATHKGSLLAVWSLLLSLWFL